MSVLLVAAIASTSSTASGATQNADPALREPGAAAAAFPPLPEDAVDDAATHTSSAAAPGVSATRSTAAPSNTASSAGAKPSAPPTPSATKKQGGSGGGAMPNTCDARYELNGKTLSVHVVTDKPPGENFYSGYLADDANGNAYGRMFHGVDFEMPYTGEPVVFIAAGASALNSGAGATGVLAPGVGGYMWCGTFDG